MNQLMRRLIFVMIAFPVALAGLQAQVVSDRSPAGSLALDLTDSSLVTLVGKPVAIDFNYEFTEPSGNNYLDAGETARLRVRISNGGRLTARGILVRLLPLSPPQGVTYSDSIVVGEIPPGETRYAIFYIAADTEMSPQIVTFGVEVHNSEGSLTDPKLLTFLTRPRMAPGK